MLTITIFLLDEDAWISCPSPAYIPTCDTAPLLGPLVSKNTKSPAFKLLLLTVVPNLLCSTDVLGSVILAAFLYT